MKCSEPIKGLLTVITLDLILLLVLFLCIEDLCESPFGASLNTSLIESIATSSEITPYTVMSSQPSTTSEPYSTSSTAVPVVARPSPSISTTATSGTFQVSSQTVYNMKVTAYCSCPKCCGKWSGMPMPNGKYPQEGRTIAADLDILPRNTIVEIEGLSGQYIVEDCGAFRGHQIDLYFADHQRALDWTKPDGYHQLIVTIIKWGDE